jgi:TrmH family RNA methyltransferase
VKNGPVILLESVRDPGNVGTVIRTAAALGMAHIILSNDCADLYHPRTVRAAMGPLFSMPVTRVDDLAGTVRLLRAEGWVVNAAALDDHAERLGEVDLSLPAGGESACRPGVTDRICALIGNEGHGLSRAVIEACDRTVYIPMEADAESLNAGAAAALVMWEMRRAVAGASIQRT